MCCTDDNAVRGGFTLVEIMITIAILGILVVIAVSDFKGLNEKYRVEAETKQLYADLMDARGRAMQRNRVFHAQITVNGYNTFEDTDPVPDGDANLTGSDTPVTSVSVDHAITTTAGLSDFRFNRNGIASVTGDIRFASTALPDYDCITIKPTRIKMGQYVGTFPGGACVER